MAVAIACGGSQPSSESAQPSSPAGTPSGQKVDESKAGNVNGKVALEGPAPANQPIKMSADPVCLRENKSGAFSEAFVTKDGGLDNVFVYVKDGLGNYVFETPTTPLKLDQDGCRYHPHVFGIRVGQPLEIVNSDPTLHNIHALPKVNSEFNVGQPVEGMKNTHTFTAKEVMVPFKCDVHGWMNAYVGVLDHPYFAVTADGGRFELKTLPPGTYTIEAWHERLGAQSQSVTVGEKETKDVTFTFKSTT
jgi:plastocyanin